MLYLNFTQNITMKKVAFLFCFLGLFQYISAQNRDFNIEINVKGISDQEAILAYTYGEKKFIADTVHFDTNGNCLIQGGKSYSDGIYLLVFPSMNMASFEFIIRDTSFKLSTDTTDFNAYMKVSNSPENKIMFEDAKRSIEVKKQIDSIQELTRDESLADKKKKTLKEEIEKLGQNFIEQRIKQIELYPNALHNKILSVLRDVPMDIKADDSDTANAQNIAYQYFIRHYWDNVDFEDVALIKSPVVIPRVIAFFGKIYQTPDSINQAVDILLKKASVNKQSFEIILSEITDHFAKSKSIGHANTYVYLLDNYFLKGSATWLDQDIIEKMQKRADAMRPTLIGKQAPDMTIYDLNNRPLNFYQSIGSNDYTVLVFWNSECGHCQKEMPELVNVFQDSLRNDNIGIFTVSTEIEREHAVNFVSEHKMREVFTNGYDPTGRSGFRVLYDITSTPVVVVLDKDKKIIAKKIAVRDLPYLIHTHKEIMAKRAKK